MKKIYLLLVALAFMQAKAQDVIVKKDGSTILSKVLEVNTEDIKYKKSSNQNGPTYTIAKTDIIAINYENGDKDDFNNYKHDANETNKGYQKTVAAPNNESIIASYNIDYPSLLDNKGKKADGYFIILGIGPNSILADENIEVIFNHYDYDKLEYESIFLERRCQECDFEILIKNKSDVTIYIDLGNTFRIYGDKSYTPFFSGEQTTITSGGSTGIGLNLGSVASVAGVGGVLGTIAGGITVGGSSNRAHSTTYTKQRILSIPPKATASLGDCEWDHPNGRGDVRRSSAESIPESNLGIKKDIVKAGEVHFYDYTASPYHCQYLFTYSTQLDFSSYTTLNADLYLREIIGTNKSYSHRTKKLEKDFKEIIGQWNSRTLCNFYNF